MMFDIDFLCKKIIHFLSLIFISIVEFIRLYRVRS